MTSWQSVYRDRSTDPASAVAGIHDGSTVALSSYGGEPQILIDALIARSDLSSLHIYQALRGGRGRILEREGFRLATYAPDKRAAQAIRADTADFLPGSIFRVCRWAETGELKADAVLIHVAPPDEKGFCSFGTSTDFTSVISPHADLVIAEVNDQMPRTLGHRGIHVSQIDHIVRVSQGLIQVPQADIDPEARSIADYVGELVPDGATLELGVGAVPAAILANLAGRRDLGIHTGLMSDALLRLVERGAVTGSRKAVDTGLIVANQVVGTQPLYDWVGSNERFHMRSALYTHDPVVLAQIDDFKAINSAMQVDLRGQVNSESLRGNRTGGTGGSIDFAIGAMMSRGGASIIALPSTAANGTISRIVPRLPEGAVVTLPATLVDYVVTEYGIATLRGSTERERARALACIAHPDHRDKLAAPQ
jgi:4-hydroxybutyrate CoA-transferase